MSVVFIRTANVDDAGILADIGRQTFYDTFAAHNKPEDMDAYMTGAFTVERLTAELSEPGSVWLVAEEASKIIGFAKVAPADPPACIIGPSPVRLVKLYVSADAIGSGVGAELIRSCLEWARISGYKTMWLGVWEHNHRARAFYERWGFVPVGTEAFLLGTDNQTDVLMQLGLARQDWMMYTPASFRMSDAAEIYAFMRKHSFASLVTQGEGGMIASHLPLLLDEGEGPHGTLIGHMARANPQWRKIEGEVLAIFPGPHAYVSPTWYETPGTVPTWNYVAVHAYGPLQLVEDRDGLHDILTRTVAVYERRMPEPWSYDVADPDIDKMLKGIVGFRIEISRLEGKAKLNQNHPEERRRKVIRALEAQGGEDAQAIATLMSATLEG